MEAQESIPKASPGEPVAVFRAASDSLAKSRYAEAIELFQRVVRISSGTRLAIEAEYFSLIARRNQLAGASTRQDLDELRTACSEWICVASDWVKSAPVGTLGLDGERIHHRIDSVLCLESQMAFSSGRWLETIKLLDQIAAHREAKVLGDVALGLMRLECYVHLERWQDAEKLIQSASFFPEEQFSQSPPPRWAENFLLRKAEVAMVLGKWNDAYRVVCNIREHFPECTVSSQVDYVLARCLIHETKFDQARQVLESVLATQPPPPEFMQTKAWWTIAESYLMQRRYPEAFAAYKQVAEIGTDPTWVELAQRQMAKCREVFGDSVAVEAQAGQETPLRSTQKPTLKQPR